MTNPFSGTFRPLSGHFVPANDASGEPSTPAASRATSPSSAILCIAFFITALLATAAITGPPAAAVTTTEGSTAPATAATATPEHRQVVTVTVKSSASTYGTLRTWRWHAKEDRYVRVGKPVRAYVGIDGVGRASEYVSRTPAGVFTLTEAFGRLRDPGTALPYRQVDLSSWWVSDVSSPHYNTFQECSPGAWCGFRQSRSEQLGAIYQYTYAVVIDYNRDPIVPGAGSAFFLHETEGKPTQGCVSIPRDRLRTILRWLDPKADPVISIGIGRAAYDLIRS